MTNITIYGKTNKKNHFVKIDSKKEDLISNTVLPDLNTSDAKEFDKNYIQEQLNTHIHKVCKKLRNENLVANCISVMLRTKDFRVFTEKMVLPEASDSEFLINQYADKLFEKIYNPEIIYRASGIFAEKLSEKSTSQLFLFEEEKTGKAKKLSELWDNFEKKYGRGKFSIGTMKDPQEENKLHGQNYFS